MRRAERLQLATAFSHGAHRCCFTAKSVPFSPRPTTSATRELDRRRAEAHTPLLRLRRPLRRSPLRPRGGRRHRRHTLGGVNEEVRIDAPVPVSHDSRSPARSGRASFAARRRAARQPDRPLRASRRPLGRTASSPAQPLTGVRLRRAHGAGRAALPLRRPGRPARAARARASSSTAGYDTVVVAGVLAPGRSSGCHDEDKR